MPIIQITLKSQFRQRHGQAFPTPLVGDEKTSPPRWKRGGAVKTFVRNPSPVGGAVKTFVRNPSPMGGAVKTFVRNLSPVGGAVKTFVRNPSPVGGAVKTQPLLII